MQCKSSVSNFVLPREQRWSEEFKVSHELHIKCSIKSVAYNEAKITNTGVVLLPRKVCGPFLIGCCNARGGTS